MREVSEHKYIGKGQKAAGSSGLEKSMALGDFGFSFQGLETESW